MRGHGGDADPGAAAEEAGAGGRRPDRRQAGKQAHLRRPQVTLRAAVKCQVCEVVLKSEIWVQVLMANNFILFMMTKLM